MITVWKWEIPKHEAFTLNMPRDAQILAVQVQQGVPCLWAQVWDQNPDETRHFRIVGTGREAPLGHGYLGTWQEEPYCWHLYEVQP